MDIRKQPFLRGVHWFMEAVNLGQRNPRAVFGGALLLIFTLYGTMLLISVLGAVIGGIAPQPGQAVSTPLLLLMVLMGVAIFLFVPVLLGGLMRVIQRAEAGQPVRARDIYQPFRDGTARRLMLFGVLQIALMVLSAIVLAPLLGAEYAKGYEAVVNAILAQQPPPPMPQPAHPVATWVWQIGFNYVSVMLLLLGIALVVLSGRRFGEAVAGGWRAAFGNLLPNLLAMAILLAALFVATALFVAVLGVVSTLLGKILPLLGVLIGLLGMLLLGCMVLVLVAGCGYVIWRDTFGSAPPSPPSSDGLLQA